MPPFRNVFLQRFNINSLSVFTLTCFCYFILPAATTGTQAELTPLYSGGIFPISADQGGWPFGQACRNAAAMVLEYLNERTDILLDYEYSQVHSIIQNGCDKLFKDLTPPEQILAFTKDKLDRWRVQVVKIGVVGLSGSGKSTIINSVRQMKKGQVGYAPVGVDETTMEVTVYDDPTNPNLKWVDIPGAGTETFPLENYLKKFPIKDYDALIVVNAGRILPEPLAWAKAIDNAGGKKVFFVRTKVDQDLCNDEKENPDLYAKHPDAARADLLSKMRKNMLDMLGTMEFQNQPKVYLINGQSRFADKLDFEALMTDVYASLGPLQQEVFLRTIVSYADQLVAKKVELLRGDILWYALGSAAGSVLGAVAPAPGLSLVTDYGLISWAMVQWASALGINKTALVSTADSIGISFDELMEFLKSDSQCWTLDILSLKLSTEATLGLQAVEIGKEIISKLLTRHVVKAKLVEQSAKFVPFVGPLIVSPISVVTTYNLLNLILDDMEMLTKSVAKRISMKSAYG